jgi:hypothetical protein
MASVMICCLLKMRRSQAGAGVTRRIEASMSNVCKTPRRVRLLGNGFIAEVLGTQLLNVGSQMDVIVALEEGILVNRHLDRQIAPPDKFPTPWEIALAIREIGSQPGGTRSTEK